MRFKISIAKYTNTFCGKCVECDDYIFERGLIVNKKHIYDIGLMYACRCGKAKLWTNSIRNEKSFIEYIEGRTTRYTNGFCNDKYCGHCFKYIQVLKNGYEYPNAHRSADLLGCLDCDNRIAYWFDLEEEENETEALERTYAKKLEKIKELIK